MKTRHDITLRAEIKNQNFDVLERLVESLKSQHANNPFVELSGVMTGPWYFATIRVHEDQISKNSIIQSAEAMGFRHSELDAEGLIYGCHTFNEYTKQEMRAAEFSWLIELTGGRNSKGHFDGLGKHLDEGYGTQFIYDEGACRMCAAGRVQVSNLRVDLNSVKRFDLARFVSHHLLSERLKDQFVAQNFTGLIYRPVEDYKNRTFGSKFYQIVITNSLPKLNEKTQILTLGERDGCRYCNNRLNILRTTMAYDRSSLRDAQDFNMTAEILGHTRSNYWVVKKRVIDFLSTLPGKRSLVHSPVEIVE